MASPAALGELLNRLAETLTAMADVTVQQREALREGRLELLQDLFRELQNLGFSAEALENQRVKLSAKLAAQLGCEETLSAICGRLSDDAALPLKAGAGELDMALRKLRSEMQILTSLVDENQRLGGMLIAEWRRLQGMYPSRPGVDFRG
ncbi:MAG: flagellar export chaperone FlgN [Aminivibrio sp.]|jgi:5'-deoxynucleotidase YfbR-like HD superfamily hydrolase